MQPNLKKLEIYLVAGVATLLIGGITYALSGPFAAEDYGLAGGAAQTSNASSSATSLDVQPALLDPALRSLDGVVHHG